MKVEERGKSGREKTNLWKEACLKCKTDSFKLYLGLCPPVVECLGCGKRYALIDSHTRLPIASQVILHTQADKHVTVTCPTCEGRSFQENSCHPCRACHGSGKMHLGTEEEREDKAKKKTAELKAKDLDPTVH